jgi:hypothetical protein
MVYIFILFGLVCFKVQLDHGDRFARFEAAVHSPRQQDEDQLGTRTFGNHLD